jgi:hypothetical protein
MHPRLIHDVAEILELARAHAYPGREAAERNAVLRALLFQLQQQSRGTGAMLYRRERLHTAGCISGNGAQ